jgi:hypothetical protein
MMGLSVDDIVAKFPTKHNPIVTGEPTRPSATWSN